MAIFSGPSTNFKNSDNAVKLALLTDAAAALVSTLDNAEAEGQWEEVGSSSIWSISETTSDRIDSYKETLRTVIEENR